MNDQFLYDARPHVRRMFAGELYERLESRIPARTRIVQFLRNPEKVFLAALAVALVAGVAWQMLNTEARFAGEVNGIAINEMNYLIIDHATCQPIEVNEDALSRPGPIPPTPEPRSLDDALRDLPYELHVPTWIPRDLTLVENHFYYDPNSFDGHFQMAWVSEESSLAMNLITRELYNGWGGSWILNRAIGSVVDINGVETVLARGDFTLPFTFDECVEHFAAGGIWRPAFWDETLGLRLMWVYDGVFYQLSSPPSHASWGRGWTERSGEFPPVLSERDLIRVAESMIP